MTSTKIDVKPPKQLIKPSKAGNFFSTLVGEKKELSKYWKIVKQIEDYEPTIQALSDSELQAKTPYFREMLKDLEGKELENKLNELLPEVFAVVREASFRTIGKKQYPVQLIGGIVLHDGRIAEMKTGEGKTYVAALAGYLNALPRKNQVHIVTVNDYLARIGASEIGQVFNFLGLSVGVVQPNSSFYFKLGHQADLQADQMRESGRVDTLEDGEQQDNKAVIDVKHLLPCDRKRAYWLEEEDRPVDIVYAVNSELGFDYLRDNMVQTVDEMSQKSGHIYAIVDEVDSILIDEARTPLIISSQDESSSQRYKQFAKLVRQLNPDLHYTVDEKRKVVTLSDLGIEKVENLLGIKNIYEDPSNVILIHHLDQALKAHALFHREKEYVVRDGEIIIVDEFTGRLMFGRRYSQGLHQAIEAKEGLEVQSESKTVATITYQNFFRMYGKLSGMTGTAATESEELFKIYKLLVVTIPTNRPMIREDNLDKIFKTEIGKFTALVRDIREIHETGQPILIGTTSIEKNALLSSLLTKGNIPHQVLNAKNHEQEARIISNAGKKGSVTLATNIAGRGVDIVLGGLKPDDVSLLPNWKQEHEEVKSLGGLFVIGTERHESRRIDNQLRGRCGRQGDPGESQFYISLEDYILRVFGGDRVGYYSRILPFADDEAIQFSTIGWLIEQAQKKIEGQNFDIRKYVTEYDDVINKQRTVIYKKRKQVLTGAEFNWEEEYDDLIYRDIYRIISNIKKPSLLDKTQNHSIMLKQAVKELQDIIEIEEITSDMLHSLLKEHNYNSKKVSLKLHEILWNKLKDQWRNYDDKTKTAMARFVYLRAIDVLWTEHLVSIDHLQDSTRLRYIAQKDPLTEFKEEAMNLFVSLLKEIDHEITTTVFKVIPDFLPQGFSEVVVEENK
jgi:preprotein translocase subunit SecA